MTQALAEYEGGAYIRIGRNPVEEVYESDDYDFDIGKAVTMREGTDITIIATGETVRVALDAGGAGGSGRVGTRAEHAYDQAA